MIREYHRFEGASDPDDMAILYAILSKCGLRGTLADAFGVYADPATAAVLDAIPMPTASPENRGRLRGAAGRSRWR